MIHNQHFVPDTAQAGQVFCHLELRMMDGSAVFQRLLAGDPSNAIITCRELCKFSCCHNINVKKEETNS